MLRIGLTGGIGSGKTTVAKIFQVLGIPVYYADLEARALMNEDDDIRKGIISQFGQESYAEGSLNRSYIAGIVFKDPAKLALLNSLTHPATIRHSKQWMQKQRAPYVIKEAALLFESGSYKDLDHIIGVRSPLELRINRVMTRDHVSREEVVKRMSRQMDEEEKMKRCDFVIDNNEENLVAPQVISLHERFLVL